MTSRLKRKLDDLEGGNLTESFVKYGTPLPALTETKKDKGEFVPIWKQEVRDEQGRRRLHGAWTGGFSAGYYNTVGSREGWTPSTFKSSRSEKAAASLQRAEDFMDEEDLEDMRASQKLQTNEQFDILDGTAGDIASRQGAAATLKDLVEPSKDRIGEKLLRKMGWREGQGIGPRISAKARRRQAAELGIMLQDDDVADAEADKHTFAPLDRELVVYDAKENMYGLGFRPVQSLHQALDEPKRPERPAGEGAARQMGGAWGLGAMEDADDDDFSVYDTGVPQGSGNVVLMDEDGDERTAFRSTSQKTRSSQPKASAVTETFNDGTPVIRYFLAASKPQPADKWFEPPEVPKDWEPDPKRVFALTPKAPPQQAAQHGLNADQRGAILGEEQLKAPIDSVFEYITAKSKERMDAFTRSGGQPLTGANTQPLPENAAPLEVPPIDPALAAAALQGFLPFSDDLAKQARYKRYLEHHAGVRPDERFQPWAAGSKVQELNHELEEFAASARIFTPMSNAMASRFTSSSVSTILNDTAPAPGLRKPAPAPAEAPKVETGEKPMPRATTAAGQAAREGRFGRLTRTIVRFYPARLACKRFNVPDPYPDGPSAEDDALDSMVPLNKRTMDDLAADRPRSPPLAITNGKENDPPQELPPKPLGSVGLGEDETQGRNTLTYERPPDALFKAIFADSEDEEEDEEDTAPAKPVAPIAEPMPAWKERVAAQPPVTEEVKEDPDLPFKPTFVPKADRQSVPSADKAQKKKKRDKAKATALSFDVEGEGTESPAAIPAKRSKTDKEGKRKKRKQEVPEEDEWVEKESLPLPPVVISQSNGRMKASDLY